MPTYIAPLEPRANAHLWKAVAPFVALEEQLFAYDPRALRRAADAFVAVSLPEANPMGRVA